jgi:hypothetical protein
MGEAIEPGLGSAVTRGTAGEPAGNPIRGNRPGSIGDAVRRRVRSRRGWAKFAISAGAGSLVAAAFLLISGSYPLPIVIGALPSYAAVALALGTALAVMALLTAPESRKPSVDMPRPGLYRLIFWWLAVAVTLVILALGSWQQWDVVLLFVAIAICVKAVGVFTYIKQDWEFAVWQPFVVIMGIFALVVGIGQYLGRSDVPPPIQAALSSYGLTRTGLQPASRAAPDLSSLGMTLESSGDLDVGGLPATLFTYHAKDGTPVDLYESTIGFPRPPGTFSASDPPGWWINKERSFMRAGSANGNFLVVGYWQRNVNRVARTLAGVR